MEGVLGYFKDLLIKIPEWWVRLDIPFTLTIGVPILIVVCIFLYLGRIIRNLKFFTIFIIIAVITAFFVLMSKLLEMSTYK